MVPLDATFKTIVSRHCRCLYDTDNPHFSNAIVAKLIGSFKAFLRAVYEVFICSYKNKYTLIYLTKKHHLFSWLHFKSLMKNKKIYNSYKKLHDPLWFVTDFPGWSKVKNAPCTWHSNLTLWDTCIDFVYYIDTMSKSFKKLVRKSCVNKTYSSAKQYLVLCHYCQKTNIDCLICSKLFLFQVLYIINY